MDRLTVVLSVFLGGIILVLVSFLSLRRSRRASRAPPEEEQPESSQQTMGSDPPRRGKVNRESGTGTAPEVGSNTPGGKEVEPVTQGREGSDETLSQRVHDHKKHLVLLRTYVSRQACGKGRALLEALGLTSTQIAKFYGMYALNEEESVQDGLQAWIGGDINATWRDLLEAMKTAGIAIQQRDRLKKELCSSAGGVDVVKDEEQTGTSATAGSDATVEYPPIIPDIKVDYIDVKDAFVDVCTTQGTPTLDQVKERCIDLIQCVFTNVPQISCYKSDIEKAETLPKLAHVVCFQLSSWISYDFFKKVIARFQPALKIVEDRLMRYEEQLKVILEQKLESIAELQQRKDSYEVPENMAEFAVKYELDADGLQVKDLIATKDFLARRLGVPRHLLQVLYWWRGSVVITYRIVEDVLPLAELALYREDARAELTQHGVEDVFFASHPSEQPGLVDQPPQTVHLQRRAIVTVLDAHRQDLDTTSLTSGLKGMGILTEEQYQKLASLDDERRHEALLYTLLAHDGPDTYDKLVECMELRDTSIAADLQATLEDVKESPGALSVIGSFKGGRRNFISTPETYDKLGVTVRNKKGTDAEHTMIRSIQDDVSGIRMKEAMCPEWNYFQVKVTATVGDGKIGIGIAPEKYPLSNFPGWMSGSVGYHADDGGLFFDGNHQLLGPTCKVGDRMGCGVDFSTVVDGPVRVWFTKNDQLVYYHTMKLQVDSASNFYPLISMETSGQEVQYMGHCQKLAPIDAVPADSAAVPKKPQPVRPIRDWKTLGECQKVIQHIPEGGGYCGVAVNSEGLLAVTDDTERSVHLLSKDGALVRSIGRGLLSDDLRGVAFDLKGNVWVADLNNHNVVKLSQKGDLLQTIHHEGSDELYHPYGVAVSQDGLVCICDYGNCRVLVYDEEGKFLFTFGLPRSGPGYRPYDVTFGSDGLVYVTDAMNTRVCVWNKEGTFKREFDTKSTPTYIAATSDNHLVITSHGSATVMVYTLKGDLVHEFGRRGSDPGSFEQLFGICIDDNGLAFVADWANNRIQAF